MEHALPRPYPLIEEARERQRRRQARLAVAALAVVAFAVAAYGVGTRLDHGRPVAVPATVALPNPCALLANADVAKVFGARVLYKSFEPYRGCTWSGWPFKHQFGQQSVTVGVARATRADFERLSTFIILADAPGSHRIAKSARIHGVGEAAYAQIFAGTDLEVYYRGVVITVDMRFVGPPLQAEKQLAAAVIERLQANEAAT